MFLEEFVLRSLSASALMKPFLTPGVAQREMRILKCFSRFEV